MSTRTLKLMTVVGARPQFVKAAVVSRAIAAFNRDSRDTVVEDFLVHTGQHYDHNMSDVFFDELSIPRPRVNLNIGSGGHGQQTGQMLAALEPVVLAERPDWMLVYGDTNSTLAGALVAAKLHVPVAHVEAGLRSFNRRMPEEINRVVTDHLAALQFCPTQTAVRNLAHEGITQGVHRVGDVMYDSVRFHVGAAARNGDALAKLGLSRGAYYLATVHRAENTDAAQRLGGILAALGGARFPVVMPIHPRTRKIIAQSAVKMPGNIRMVEPLAYLDMLALMEGARMILTDSGGVQKEAYWLGKPCVTLREETEWVELVEAGCNRLTGTDPAEIDRAIAGFEARDAALPADRPDDLYGAGDAGDRIVRILCSAAQALSEP